MILNIGSFMSKYNNKFFAILISCIIFTIYPSFLGAAVFKIKHIELEGIGRIEDGVIFNAIPVKVGDNFDTKESYKIIRDLYKTGYFNNVDVYRKKDTLVIKLEERPVIKKLSIEGNELIPTDNLLKVLKSVDIAAGRTFNPVMLDKVEQELEKQYYNQGKYSVKVVTVIKNVDNNTVLIKIKVEEGVVAKISKVNIIGNSKFTSSELLSLMELKKSDYISFFTKSDNYSKQKLTGDLERLKAFYIDRGFVNFKIKSTQVFLTPDKKSIYININIYEGRQYTISEVGLSGKITLSKSKLLKITKNIKPGELFSNKKIIAVKTGILDLFAVRGYSFADVTVIKDIDEKSAKVAINYFIKPGKRVYVRRVNIHGNFRTQDYVIRKVLVQLEGSYYSKTRVEESKRRLYQLGYLKDINIDITQVPGTDDQVDLDVTVTEANAGNFTGGIGYSPLDGAIGNISVSQDNFLGTGKKVSFYGSKSKAVTSLGGGYSDPFYTIDGIGVGANTYYNKTKAKELAISNYTSDSAGLDGFVSIPMSLYDRVVLSLGYQNKKITTSSDPSKEIKDFIGSKTRSVDYDLYNTVLAWTRVTLDRSIFPTEGLEQNLRANIIIPGSTIKYYKIESETRYYVPLYNIYVLLFRAGIKYGDGFGGTKELPFFENFYAGGIGTVRGYEDNSLGPEDSKNAAMGGNISLSGTMSFNFPLPYIDADTVRTSVFVDAGNVFDESLELNKMRYTVGLAGQWLSPMGPLAVSIATPIKKFAGDRTKAFQFHMGTTF